MSQTQEAAKLLGVELPTIPPDCADPEATLEDWKLNVLRPAWRAAAKKHHPDLVPEAQRKAATDRFAKLSDANDRLQGLQVRRRERPKPPPTPSPTPQAHQHHHTPPPPPPPPPVPSYVLHMHMRMHEQVSATLIQEVLNATMRAGMPAPEPRPSARIYLGPRRR